MNYCIVCSKETASKKYCGKECMGKNMIGSHLSDLTKMRIRENTKKAMNRPEVKNKLSINNGMKKIEVRKKMKLIQKEVQNRPYMRDGNKKRMLNGGAAKANASVKNPSNPQKKLYELIRSWFPQARLNYPLIIVNKNLDIALPNFKIWFEYDGSYWHQDKEKDLERQKLIEDQGWRCIRYRDKIPTEEEFIQDVRSLF